MPDRRLKVAIEFRVEEPRQGIGTAVLALLHGLNRLEQTGQEYVLLVKEKHAAFFAPYVSGACSLVAVPEAPPSRLAGWKTRLREIPLLAWIWRKARPAAARLPASDGTAERLGCDLIHFPSQFGYTTALPSIYQPWDLQHRHFPEFFSPRDYHLRETLYRGFCERARFVCVQTEWTKQDVVTEYGVDPAKVVVIRWGTAFEAYAPPSAEERESVRHELALPPSFFLYPAVCWPHKNHAIILRALALLRERTGRTHHVIFTGAPTEHQAEVDALMRELKLEDAVRFLGFTSSRHIQVLFHLATALVFPSRFEGLGLPVLEAFRMDLPVISSDATVLPEVTAGAAILFDPDAPEELARGMQALLDSPELRDALAAQGREVLKSYSIDETARQFFDLYQRTAGNQT